MPGQAVQPRRHQGVAFDQLLHPAQQGRVRVGSRRQSGGVRHPGAVRVLQRHEGLRHPHRGVVEEGEDLDVRAFGIVDAAVRETGPGALIGGEQREILGVDPLVGRDVAARSRRQPDQPRGGAFDGLPDRRQACVALPSRDSSGGALPGRVDPPRHPVVDDVGVGHRQGSALRRQHHAVALPDGLLHQMGAEGHGDGGWEPSSVSSGEAEGAKRPSATFSTKLCPPRRQRVSSGMGASVPTTAAFTQ